MYLASSFLPLADPGQHFRGGFVHFLRLHIRGGTNLHSEARPPCIRAERSRWAFSPRRRRRCRRRLRRFRHILGIPFRPCAIFSSVAGNGAESFDYIPTLTDP